MMAARGPDSPFDLGTGVCFGLWQVAYEGATNGGATSKTSSRRGTAPGIPIVRQQSAAAGYQAPIVARQSPGLPRKLNIWSYQGGWGDAVLDDKLWEIAERADWRLMTVKALALGVFVVAVVPIWNSIRIWKRMRTIKAKLKKMQKEINILQIQESRLMAELNANSKAEIASACRTEP